MDAPSLTIFRADSFVSRLLGLLLRARLSADEALYLAPCNSIHTVLMRYSIDVAFVDREGRVVSLVHGLKPFRAAWCRHAHGAVELVAGAARRHGIFEGALLSIRPVETLQQP